MGRSPYPLQHRFHLWLRDVPSLFFLALPLGGLPVLLVQPQQTGGVGLVDQQLPHPLLRPVVLGVGRLFLCHEPCKFFVQAPDRGQLFQTERIKGFLRRLVDEDVALMLRKVSFRVPRLAVAGVNAARPGIVHDVRPQGLYLARVRRI